MTEVYDLVMLLNSGYMSPEYAMNGIISEKSDVYSFGVMMLETITGKKVTSVNDTDDRFTLVGHVSILTSYSSNS